uniref:Uncharacterized protein n=1 Tax=Sphaerodactylus townsendi TaxID=933632 RepID=A0ACB8F7E5_9SAUR
MENTNLQIERGASYMGTGRGREGLVTGREWMGPGNPVKGKVPHLARKGGDRQSLLTWGPRMKQVPPTEPSLPSTAPIQKFVLQSHSSKFTSLLLNRPSAGLDGFSQIT